MDDIRNLVPTSKFDFERTEAAIRAGYPAVEPILGKLMEWLKDNWPISRKLNDFLSTIGEPLVPHLWSILRSDDDAWKYWTMGLIRSLPEAAAAQFRAELTRLCYAPQPDEKANDLNEKAQWVLEHFGWLLGETEAMAYIDQVLEIESVRALIAKADYFFDRGDRTGSLAWMVRAENAVLNCDPIPSAALHLVSAYRRGLGVGSPAERSRMALNLLERVGEAGNLSAIHALTTNYFYGLNGAPKDQQRFMYWADKAAEFGSDGTARALLELNRAGASLRGDDDEVKSGR